MNRVQRSVPADVSPIASVRPQREFRHGRRQRPDPQPVLWMLAAVLVWASLWVLLPTWSDAAPSSDNVEQLVWAQGFELGYHKHPPLPTWILIGAEQVFAPSLPLTYALSIVGMLIGGCFLWRLASDLLGRSAALPAVLATGCIAFFSYRAHIYNHNTVLVPFVYASAWFFLRGVRTGKSAYWVLLGVTAAAAMLTKYQFVVILGTFALLAIWLKLYLQPQIVRGATLAAAIAALLVAPHAWWLVTHDYQPFHYASQMVLARLGPLERGAVTGGFLLQQIRDALVAVLMLLLAVWPAWRAQRDKTFQVAVFHGPNRDRVWVLTLGLAPLGLMLLLGLAGGVRLENHWGTTALQFIALPLLLWLRERRLVPTAGAVLIVFFVVQAAEAAYDVSIELRNRRPSPQADNRGQPIRGFEPRSLARAVGDDWQRSTHARLRYLVGSTTWGGFVSLYLQDHPQVLIGGNSQASPWVSMQNLAKCGGVYFEPTPPPVGAAVAGTGEWLSVDFTHAHRGQPLRVRWAIVPPGPQCH